MKCAESLAHETHNKYWGLALRSAAPTNCPPLKITTTCYVFKQLHHAHQIHFAIKR